MEFRDLKAQYNKYKTQIDLAILEVIQGANFIGGKQVNTLEKRLAEYVGVKHCISCANGTEAMTLLMMSWDIKEGDAVFVPDFTFFSTGEVVSFRGATPIFVDVDRDTFNIDTIKLEKTIQKVIAEGKLTPKLIIPVDLFGLPANHIEIEKIAEIYDLKILEDAAQGFGGSIHGKKACSFGDVATTSFFPAKPLGCYGDGGAIFTDDDALAAEARCIANHGMVVRYHHDRIGVNSRLDSIQAAVLDVKLKYLDGYIRNRQAAANFYDTAFETCGRIKIPVRSRQSTHVFHQYTVCLDESVNRDLLRKRLDEKGIPAMVYYPIPLHLQKAYQDERYKAGDFPVAEKLVRTVLSLPMHTELDKEQLDFISKTVCQLIEECLIRR